MVKYSSRQLSAVYGAISHPVRRRLLDDLRPAGATVSQLAARYPLSLPGVSKHIRVLEAAGLVRRTIRGREHHLVLDPSPLIAATGWLDSYRTYWNDRLDVLEARLRRQDR